MPDTSVVCPAGAIAPHTQAELTVSDFVLVRTKPAAPASVDLVYSASLRNSRGVPVRMASALVSTSDFNATMPDDALEFGLVPAGTAAESAGTFTIRQNSASPFNPCAVSLTLTTPPELAPQYARGVELGTTMVIELEASDPEDDTLTFLAESLPDDVSLNEETGTLTIAATGEPKSFPVYVRVSDGVFEDSTTIDIATYSPGTASPPTAPLELSIPPEVSASLPRTSDGHLVLSASEQTGNPDAPTVALVYDPTADDAVARWGACLSRVVACSKTNDIGTFASCVPMIKGCADDTGGVDCCPPRCIDAFITLVNEGAPVMKALQESFLDGGCQEGMP